MTAADVSFAALADDLRRILADSGPRDCLTIKFQGDFCLEVLSDPPELFLNVCSLPDDQPLRDQLFLWRTADPPGWWPDADALVGDGRLHEVHRGRNYVLYELATPADPRELVRVIEKVAGTFDNTAGDVRVVKHRQIKSWWPAETVVTYHAGGDGA